MSALASCPMALVQPKERDGTMPGLSATTRLQIVPIPSPGASHYSTDAVQGHPEETGASGEQPNFQSYERKAKTSSRNGWIP